MAINSPSFQGKGCKEFSRRGGIQKKPKEIGICLQLKRAFLSKNPVRMHVKAGTGSPHLQPSGITYCAKCTPSQHAHAPSHFCRSTERRALSASAGTPTWTVRLRRGRRWPHSQYLPNSRLSAPYTPGICSSSRPRPGRKKTFSMMTPPANRKENCMPRMVRTGTQALGSAWREITRRHSTPLAEAARI